MAAIAAARPLLPNSRYDRRRLYRELREWSLSSIERLPGPFVDFLGPWGNRIEIVAYDNIQFTKAPNVLHGMGLAHLSKNDAAIEALTDKGMAPY